MEAWLSSLQLLREESLLVLGLRRSHLDRSRLRIGVAIEALLLAGVSADASRLLICWDWLECRRGLNRLLELHLHVLLWLGMVL